MEKISVILPCHNVEALLYTTYRNIIQHLKSMNITFELIFIDNGSHDATLSILQEITKEDYRCNYLSMTYSHSLLDLYYLGSRIAIGDLVAFMDISDPVDILTVLYTTLKETKGVIVGGILKASDHKAKEHKQPLLKMFQRTSIKDALEQNSYALFRQFILKNPNTIWVSFLEIERHQATPLFVLSTHLRIFCGERFSQYVFAWMIGFWIILPLFLYYLHLYRNRLMNICLFIVFPLSAIIIAHIFVTKRTMITIHRNVRFSSYPDKQ